MQNICFPLKKKGGGEEKEKREEQLAQYKECCDLRFIKNTSPYSALETGD